VFVEGRDIRFDSRGAGQTELGKILRREEAFVQAVRHRGSPPTVKSLPVPVARQRRMKVVKEWHGESQGRW
jgi:hypothetical protein